MKKKDFTKFTKRNVHKRKSKDAARRELLRAVRECGVAYDGVKIRDIADGGSRYTAVSSRDESVETRGIFRSSKGGYGFVSLEEGGDDIFIPSGRTHGAIDGDFVEISYKKYKGRYGDDKTEGRVLRIIEYGRRTVIGTLDEELVRHGRHTLRIPYIIPDDTKIGIRPRVRDIGAARLGDKVEASILRDGSSHPDCEIIRIFGKSDSREANYGAILSECEIITDFTPEELAEADRLAKEPITREGRVDRTGDIIFTIDGEGAKDLDDAISLRRLSGGRWRLGVHIADVSHYVRERTPLDRCVMARATSVYFTDKVVPMLPKSLSNGACSLNSGEEKYALSAIIDIDSEGNIIKCVLEESVINSRVRGVYSEVNALLSGDADAETKKKYSKVLPTLHRMHELYEILAKKSRARGALDFDADEAVIVLDESGAPADIVKRERGVGERMIEQFMLAANEAVANYLSDRKIPCVYRIHEKPPYDAYSDFLVYLTTLGFDVSSLSRTDPTPSELSGILEKADERGMLAAVSYTMLRAMAKARYSDECSGHFGLGIEKYCHFTSPIRRLSDLATHRMIKRACFEGKRPESYASYARRAAIAATDGEIRAVTAERKIENLYKVIYMSGHIGEIYPAAVSSVTGFGLFAALDNTVEGLVPISEMPGVFTFYEKNLTLRSRDAVYRVADRLFVRVEEADIIRGNIRFSISDEQAYKRQNSRNK